MDSESLRREAVSHLSICDWHDRIKQEKTKKKKKQNDSQPSDHLPHDIKQPKLYLVRFIKCMRQRDVFFIRSLLYFCAAKFQVLEVIGKWYLPRRPNYFAWLDFFMPNACILTDHWTNEASQETFVIFLKQTAARIKRFK